MGLTWLCNCPRTIPSKFFANFFSRDKNSVEIAVELVEPSRVDKIVDHQPFFSLEVLPQV